MHALASQAKSVSIIWCCVELYERNRDSEGSHPPASHGSIICRKRFLAVELIGTCKMIFAAVYSLDVLRTGKAGGSGLLMVSNMRAVHRARDAGPHCRRAPLHKPEVIRTTCDVRRWHWQYSTRHNSYRRARLGGGHPCRTPCAIPRLVHYMNNRRSRAAQDTRSIGSCPLRCNI